MEPHWEALKPETRALFERMAGHPFIHEFYLAGGTGLALQIGHRFSDDLDFFADSPDAVGPEHRSAMMAAIADDPDVSLTWDKDGTFVARWHGIGLSFFRLDRHPLARPSLVVAGIRVAVVEEIGAMKLASIMYRGTRKDYVDLYFILQQVPLVRLFEVATVKYPYNRAFPEIAVRALAYFEDADDEPMPNMILSANWSAVKTYLENQAMEVGRRRLDLENMWK